MRTQPRYTGTIVYPYAGALYLNITNRCPVRCSYCIKYRWAWRFRGHPLRLKKEPTVEEIIAALRRRRLRRFREIVFCGYGEPLLRYPVVLRVADWLRSRCPGLRIRVNTNGLANAALGKDVCPSLKGRVDVVSVSMNAADEQTYAALHHTRIRNPVSHIKQFVRSCTRNVPRVVVTCIRHPQIDRKAVRDQARLLKVAYRSRPYLDEYKNA